MEFFYLYPLHVSAHMGHRQAEYTTSQSLEAIMPSTDPLILLGCTIIIRVHFVFWRLHLCRFSSVYEVGTGEIFSNITQFVSIS
jgi:hypothetical protein